MSNPKKVLAVFAHPDDEAFGPGGTIKLWINQGAKVDLLCATKGEAGKNEVGGETGSIRSKELEKSAKILGIRSVKFLGFKDGEICNNDLQKLEKIISDEIKELKPDTMVTFDPNGISGHLDHIAVSSAATHSFRKTKIAKKLYYFVITKEHTEQIDRLATFIHMPEGRSQGEIQEMIEVSSVWKQKIEAMWAHISQKDDVEFVLGMEEKVSKPKIENFLVLEN